MGRGAGMQALCSVKRDATFHLEFQRGVGDADLIAIYETDSAEQLPYFEVFEVGPFDTNLDIATWLMKCARDCGVLKLL